MTKEKLSAGVVHAIPIDVRQVIFATPKVHVVWEWICWIESAKKQETRDRRIRIMCENLLAGKRRPCCWAGCIHR